MAQGNLKLAKKKSARVTKNQKNPKAAAPKICKPKKVSTKEKQVIKLARQHQAKLVSNTEKLISSRVGHLEMLKGDRRTLEKEERLKAQNAKK
ncbi:hypothetical protein CANINC_002564 [Pichia inconspicua]|uniref:Uncharacterized protein n=1 Tax=Pichia inconspicua TaxID=52247 RepID=A0A4T0X136_9ASCO|nr:hypothetical protein CANINC_002564 [[Candida] inconspicua]